MKFVIDNFNQVSLHDPPPEILEVYKDVEEINEIDSRGYRMCRPLFSHSDLGMVMNLDPVKYEEVEPKENYLYIVTLHHHNALAAKHLNLIPEHILKDIKKKRCKLVLDNTLEGDVIEPFLEALYESIEKLRLPIGQIYFVTNNLIGEELFADWKKDKLIDHINFLSFPWNIHDVQRLKREGHLPEEVNVGQEAEYKILNQNKIVPFLKVNRTGRPERNLFMLFVNKYNLYDKFKISFNQYYDEYNLFEFFPELIEESNIEDLKSKVPFDIDKSDEENHGPPGLGKGYFDADKPFNPEHYRNTLVSIVMCAFPFVEGTCHLHSSTFNPMYCGHPVIQFGPYRHLAAMRKLGFKTFDKWWDEGYDNVKEGWSRFRRVLEIVEELYKKDDSELLDMYKDMIPTLQHNSDLIQNFNGPEILKNFILK